jgi:hypothetical protein
MCGSDWVYIWAFRINHVLNQSSPFKLKIKTEIEAFYYLGLLNRSHIKSAFILPTGEPRRLLMGIIKIEWVRIEVRYRM